MPAPWQYRGRVITLEDIACIQQLIREHSGASRRAFSAKLCAAWQWRQANGKPCDMICRGLLLMLHRAGEIELPPVRYTPPNPLAKRQPPAAMRIDTTPIQGPLSQLQPVEFQSVRRTTDEPLFNRAIEQFGRQLRSSLAGLSNDLTEMRSRKGKLEREIRNFTSAIGESGHSKYILEEIAIREKEISAITDRLLSAAPDSIQSKIEEMARFVSEGIGRLCEALNENSPLAKQELHSHSSAIRMFPTEGGEGWYYIAEGTWDLLGTDPYAPIFGVPADGRIRMVAGGGFEPPTFGL